MTRRRLTPEEVELWQKVAARTQRLHPEKELSLLPLPKPKPVKKPVPRTTASVAKAPETPASAHPAAKAGPNMDHKKYGRMKRGKLAPEGRLDLHGMTLDQAHPALIRFILKAQADGKRLVLVITGKGRETDGFDPVPRHRGILKRQVPHWLEIPPLAQAVLQVTTAHTRHGGGGALYVYLRKNR